MYKRQAQTRHVGQRETPADLPGIAGAPFQHIAHGTHGEGVVESQAGVKLGLVLLGHRERAQGLLDEGSARPGRDVRRRDLGQLIRHADARARGHHVELPLVAMPADEGVSPDHARPAGGEDVVGARGKADDVDFDDQGPVPHPAADVAAFDRIAPAGTDDQARELAAADAGHRGVESCGTCLLYTSRCV